VPSNDTRLAEPYARDVAAVGRIDAVPRILEVVCRTTGMGFAAVARVTEERWVACAVRDEIAFGLVPGGELDITTTICNEVRAGNELVAIDHVAQDDTYCRHHTPAMYGFQSYISVPIRLADGSFFGTLCAIDPNAARVNTPQTISMFELFADLIAFHLLARDRLVADRRELLDQRRDAELRDQFIAVLGHDLRNPLAAVRTAAGLLAAQPASPLSTRAINVIQNSATRMAGLIENVLDFARGRLGGGVPVVLQEEPDLAVALDPVVTELRTAFPDRTIQTDWKLDQPVVCDRARIAQLFSNLLANALTHGDARAPVRVDVASTEHEFVLAVANAGEPIPPDRIDQLFQPFSRASQEPGREGLGLGLGLYIASEIARAHEGTLDVHSSSDETCFTFRMPRLER
jgi:signal transduction histidine kinase